MRHPTLLAEEARRKLRELLERYEVLRRVIEYRDALQQLWNESAANPARALTQLREWCRRAEASGIGALREFALGAARPGRALQRAPRHFSAPAVRRRASRCASRSSSARAPRSAGA